MLQHAQRHYSPHNHFSAKLVNASAQLKQHTDQHPPLQWKNAQIFAKELHVKREKLQQCFYVQFGKKIRMAKKACQRSCQGPKIINKKCKT
jgi:hypothetical protein